MIIDSPAFEHLQPIPTRYTCEGEDVSPALRFQAIPAGVKSLVLIMDDPDAPRGTFDHWIAWNLLPTQTSLPEGATMPMLGVNGYGDLRYRGPCPPPGKPHRYFFKLYALNTMLTLKSGASKHEVEKAMQGHIVAQAELIGTYQR